MDPDELVRMANQIARFHAAYPRDVAVRGIAEHLERFWPPEMRAQLMLVSERDDLEPLVVAALEQAISD